MRSQEDNLQCNAAAIAETIHDAKAYGFSVQQTAPFDWPTFKNKRDAYIKRLNGIHERNLSNDKVECLHSTSRLVSKNQVEVTLDDGSKVLINAKKIVLAVGGKPNAPPAIPVLSSASTRTASLAFRRSPRRLPLSALATLLSSLLACSTPSARRLTCLSAMRLSCAT